MSGSIGSIHVLDELRLARTPLFLVLELVRRLRIRIRIEVTLLIEFIQFFDELHFLLLVIATIIFLSMRKR